MVSVGLIRNALGIGERQGFEILDVRVLTQAEVVEGAEIARFRVVQTAPNPKLEVNPDMSGRIEFGQGFLRGQALLPTLASMKDFVDNHVLPQFQSAFP